MIQVRFMYLSGSIKASRRIFAGAMKVRKIMKTVFSNSMKDGNPFQCAAQSITIIERCTPKLITMKL
jgi:hypothetical protein